MKYNAQEQQDEIFRQMSPEDKLELGAQLWLLGRTLKSAHTYESARPPTAPPQYREDPR